MNLRKLSLITAMAGLTTLGVVGCSSNVDDFTNVSGTAIDDYLENATCCIDSTGDGSCADENASKTDSKGLFSTAALKSAVSTASLLCEITSETKQVATDGTRSAAPAIKSLTAPAGFTTITPISTLVQVALTQGTFQKSSGTAFTKAELLIETKKQIAGLLGLTTETLDSDYLSSGASNSSSSSVADVAKAIVKAIATTQAAIESKSTKAAANPIVALQTAIKLVLSDKTTLTAIKADASNVVSGTTVVAITIPANIDAIVAETSANVDAAKTPAAKAPAASSTVSGVTGSAG